MCSLKASLPLASSSCVTTAYSTMEMSRGEWPYRSQGQVLGKCSTKVLVNRLIQLMFTTALSRRAQIQLFPDWLLHHVYLLPLYQNEWIISWNSSIALFSGGRPPSFSWVSARIWKSPPINQASLLSGIRVGRPIFLPICCILECSIIGSRMAAMQTLFYNISQSSTRFRSCYTPNIQDKSFHHEVTESGDELHLAVLLSIKI